MGQVLSNIRGLFNRLDRYLKDLKDELEDIESDPASGVCVSVDCLARLQVFQVLLVLCSRFSGRQLSCNGGKTC
jgi:hypothetical protein